ncbi:hypothetical protein SLS56_005335 [Neofusicoccum ribis]|uniref:Uncharacterized protein n=1 Tax=Neofusicoccum ribis TaxID=45134 RepID=A0ABR3STW4_9PEZI
MGGPAKPSLSITYTFKHSAQLSAARHAFLAARASGASPATQHAAARAAAGAALAALAGGVKVRDAETSSEDEGAAEPVDSVLDGEEKGEERLPTAAELEREHAARGVAALGVQQLRDEIVRKCAVRERLWAGNEVLAARVRKVEERGGGGAARAMAGGALGGEEQARDEMELDGELLALADGVTLSAAGSEEQVGGQDEEDDAEGAEGDEMDMD